MVDPIEDRIEVDVYDPVATLFDEALGGGDRHVGRALRPKPEAHRREAWVEDRGEHLEQRLLDEAVHHGGPPSIRLPPSGLGVETRRTGCGR